MALTRAQSTYVEHLKGLPFRMPSSPAARSVLRIAAHCSAIGQCERGDCGLSPWPEGTATFQSRGSADARNSAVGSASPQCEAEMVHRSSCWHGVGLEEALQYMLMASAHAEQSGPCCAPKGPRRVIEQCFDPFSSKKLM